MPSQQEYEAMKRKVDRLENAQSFKIWRSLLLFIILGSILIFTPAGKYLLTAIVNLFV